jgi:hypothetical protein
MRIISSLSAITGIILIVLHLFGVYAMISTSYFFFTGCIFIMGSVIIHFYLKHIQERKIKSILEEYKNKKTEKEIPETIESVAFKGWSMNNSPFRSRKSGVTWYGGNMKGANAARGERKTFLRK